MTKNVFMHLAEISGPLKLLLIQLENLPCAVGD